jgi:hypothetical protein
MCCPIRESEVGQYGALSVWLTKDPNTSPSLDPRRELLVVSLVNLTCTLDDCPLDVVIVYRRELGTGLRPPVRWLTRRRGCMARTAALGAGSQPVGGSANSLARTPARKAFHSSAVKDRVSLEDAQWRVAAPLWSEVAVTAGHAASVAPAS